MIKLIASVLFCCAVGVAVLLLILYVSVTGVSLQEISHSTPDINIIASFDAHVEEAMSQARSAAYSVPKHFWIKEGDPAPVPDQNLFGQATDPKELQWLLDEASSLLDGQSTVFSTDIQILEKSVINYYLDESILAITWKQVMDNIVYTISEVKIVDASQFRRYIVEDPSNPYKVYTAAQMSQMNNAVVASSADFYLNRKYGTVVYNREVKRVVWPYVQDVCHVDSNGDMIFTYRAELENKEDTRQFVEDNDIIFSISFGPVLIHNGVRCEPYHYAIGEINDGYPRAALCQYDKLHYLVVAATAEGKYRRFPNIHSLAKNLESLGVQHAYTLDGGQTANIIMNHQLINTVNYDYVKPISDIIYFATAVPNKE